MDSEDKKVLLDAIETLADAVYKITQHEMEVAQYKANVVIGMVDALRSTTWYDNDEDGTYVDYFTYLELEAENTILKEREDGLNHALKLADDEIDNLHKALEEIKRHPLLPQGSLSDSYKGIKGA